MKTQSTPLRDSESRQEILPVFFYFIDYVDAQAYFTNYDQDLIVSGGSAKFGADPKTFTKAQISHDRIDESADMTPRQVGVTLAANDPNLRQYFLSAPVKGISIEIYRANPTILPGTIDLADTILEFKGVAQSCGFKGYTVSANFISPLLQEDRIIPRYTYQKTCNHQVYSKQCKVVQSLYATSITVSAVNRFNKTVDVALTTLNIDSPSRAITISTETFNGGLLKDAGGNNYGIMANEIGVGAGLRLWLEWWPPNIQVGDTITIYPGCLRIPRICNALFNNLANFGGMPYVPTANPATDSILTGNDNS